MTLSWDLFIIVGFAIMAGVGALLGRGKALNILLGSFMGYVVATELGSLVFGYAKSFSHTENFSLFLVKLALFAVIIIVLNAKTELGGKGGDDSSLIINLVYGFLAAGFMTTAILSFLEPGEKANLLASSGLLTKIDQLKLIWIVAPIGFLFIADFVKGKISK
ncbi:MAG: hypothetical protein Q7S53_04645 [bacterium]|nr:hypothetical protein [bacterium]